MRFKMCGHGAAAEYFVDGKAVTRREYNQALRRSTRRRCPKPGEVPLWAEGKPVPVNKSESSAVDPSQRFELMEGLKKAGVPTFVDEDGCPHLTSREHSHRYCKALGYFNRDENQ